MIAEESREVAPAGLRDRVRAAVQLSAEAGPPGPAPPLGP
jgi:hypothetical protein